MSENALVADTDTNLSVYCPTEYYCEHCHRRCITKEGLRRHIESCSARDDPFCYCDLCHTPFIDTALLDEHKKKCGGATNSFNRDKTCAHTHVDTKGLESNLTELVDDESEKGKNENDLTNNMQENNDMPLPGYSPHHSSKEDSIVPPSKDGNCGLDNNFIGIVNGSAHLKDTVGVKIVKGSK